MDFLEKIKKKLGHHKVILQENTPGKFSIFLEPLQAEHALTKEEFNHLVTPVEVGDEIILPMATIIRLPIILKIFSYAIPPRLRARYLADIQDIWQSLETENKNRFLKTLMILPHLGSLLWYLLKSRIDDYYS